MKRVLILGVTGMLGNATYRYLSQCDDVEAFGTTRSRALVHLLGDATSNRVISNVDVERVDCLVDVLAQVRPDVVINCIGLVKQLSDAIDPLVAIPLNSIFPHRLARLCTLAKVRLVHISTDCVFSGKKGSYVEEDPADANDLYGMSKLLGELDHTSAVTLRTSIIGHELASTHGLVEWFLNQRGSIKGFTKAIFSGLPTVELARVIHRLVLPNPLIHGLLHVSSAPISKFDLLHLAADAYGHDIEIIADDKLRIDRSLISTRFNVLTGYKSPDWPALVADMMRTRPAKTGKPTQ